MIDPHLRARRRALVVMAVVAGAAGAGCGGRDATSGSADAPASAAVDSVALLRGQLSAGGDSLTRVLAQLDSGSAQLARIDAARGQLEVQVARHAEVDARLAANAPGVLARLGSFVDEHRRLIARLAALDDTVRTLRTRVAALERENSALRRQVRGLRRENRELRALVARLEADSLQRARHLASVDSSRRDILDRASRAFVAIASRDSLGRLGIAGRTNALRLGDVVLKRLDPRVFRAIDTRVDTLIAVSAAPSQWRMLSMHPSGSYVVIDDGGSSRLRVIDADAFWSTSRYLTIMTAR